MPSAARVRSRSARRRRRDADHARPSRRCRWRCPARTGTPAAAGYAARPPPTRTTSRGAQPGRRQRTVMPTTSAGPTIRPSRIGTCRGRLGRDLPVVGDDHDRGAGRVQLAQQRHHPRAGGRVEVAGRLVGQQQRRVADHRPGDRRPAAARRRTARAAGGRSRWPRPTRSSAASARRRRSAPGTPGVEQAVGHVVQRRYARRRGGTAGTRSRSGCARSADSCRSDSRRDVVPVDADRARRWAGPGCRSGAASWTCPSRTGRRWRPARRARSVSDDPAERGDRRRGYVLARPVVELDRPGRSVTGHPHGQCPRRAPSPVTSTRPSANRPVLHRDDPGGAALDHLDAVAALGQRQQRRHRHGQHVRALRGGERRRRPRPGRGRPAPWRRRPVTVTSIFVVSACLPVAAAGVDHRLDRR